MNKKNFIFTIFVAIAMIMLCPQGLWAQTQPANGDGSTSNPYQIGNEQELLWFANQVNASTDNAGLCAMLTADINLYSILQGKNSWTPIGLYTDDYSDGSYSGTFDGNNHSITNLFINENLQHSGLFAKLSGTVKNLSVSGEIYGQYIIGLIAGDADGASIDNCSTEGYLQSNNEYCGGITGSAYNTTISNCRNAANVTSLNKQLIGGIVGYGVNTTISHCFNEGTITSGGYDTNGNNGVGGILGWGVTNISIEYCCNYGSVISPEYAGGIAGKFAGSMTGCIAGCKVFSQSTGNSGVFIGRLSECVSFTNNYYSDVNLNNRLYSVPQAYFSGLSAIGGGLEATVQYVQKEQFSSGELCYLINGDQSDIQWYQTIGTDGMPYPFSNGHLQVYVQKKCTGDIASYNNTNEPDLGHDLTAYKSGETVPNAGVANISCYYCSVCGKFFSDAECTQEISKKDVFKIIVTKSQPSQDTDGTYLIGTMSELFWFADHVNTTVNTTGNKYNAKLINDITVNSNVLNADGTLNTNYEANFIDWTPIGSKTKPYIGTFDGNGHYISGLYTYTPDEQCVGLFGCVISGGTIKNVGVVDSYFKGEYYIGSIAGSIEYGTVSNCYADCLVGVESRSGGFGGLIGLTFKSTVTIENCCQHMTAGVIGVSYETPTITNTYFLTTTSGTTNGKTEEEFASGEVAYLLNSNNSNPIWGQNLSSEPKDNVPRLGAAKVYVVGSCTSPTGYSNDQNTTIHSSIVHHDATSNCTTSGNIEYWECSDCGKKYIDGNLLHETTNVITDIDANAHPAASITHHNAVAATCTVNGAIEYWECTNCGKKYSNETTTTEVSSVVVNALGHNYIDGYCSRCNLPTHVLFPGDNYIGNVDVAVSTSDNYWWEICGYNEANFYKFTATGTGTVTVAAFSRGNWNSCGILTDADKQNVLTYDDYSNNSVSANDFKYSYGVTAGTTYYVGIRPKQNYTEITDCTLRVTCSWNPTLTYESGDNGTLSVKNGDTDVESGSTFTASDNTEITATAIPDEGYKFIRWIDQYGTYISTDATYTFTMNESRYIKPVFGCDHKYVDGICSKCGDIEALTPNDNGTAEDTSDDYYELKRPSDVVWFSSYVNAGNDAVNAKVMADIDFTTSTYATPMIGSPKYSGTFDGNGHKITVDINRTANDAALFGNLFGTVKNLTVDGTITTSAMFAAGICAHSFGGTVSCCTSLVDIKSSINGDGTHAGICALADGGATINNCIFAGKIEQVSNTTTNCGGIIGYATSASSISSCLMMGEITVSTSGSYTISRNPDNATVTNCYYKTAFGDVNTGATQVTEAQIENGEVAFLLNGRRANGAWGQNVTTDPKDTRPVIGGPAIYPVGECANTTFAEYSNDKTTYIHSGEFVDHAAVPGTCLLPGNIEYWECASCGLKWSDEARTTEVTDLSIGIPAAHRFESVLLSESADANGLYSVVCDYGCGTVEDNAKAIKEINVGQNIVLYADEDGNYSTEDAISLTDASKIGVTVTFNSTNVSKPSYTRTMTNLWGTIVLPFSTTAAGCNGCELFTLTDVSDDALVLTKATTLAAGVPAFVRSYSGNLSITADNSQVSTIASTADAVDGLTLTGTFVSKDIADEDGYAISNNIFWNIADLKNYGGTTHKVTLSPFRAYLAGTLASGAKSLGITIDGVDAIDALNAVMDGKAEYYDLSGKRISDLQKGVNIVKYGNGNTKKVIIK